MPTLVEIISSISVDYFIQDNDAFLDLLAYFLRADCQCISLSCLYRNDKIERIVIKTNSNKKKDLNEVYENILKIIEYIKDLLRNFDSELNMNIYEDFIGNIMKYKFLQDPDFKKLLKEMDVNTDDIRNNLSQVVPEEWQDMNDELSNLIKLRLEVFLKLIDDCKNVKFSMENIENLFYLDSDETGNISLNTELIHSELLVFDIMNYYYYYNTDLQFTFEDYYYIGSNFKNCPCCGILINILNDNNEIQIETNGCHLKYYGSWPFPPVMNDDNIDLLKMFFDKLIENDNDNEDRDKNLKTQITNKIKKKAKSCGNIIIEPTIDWGKIFDMRMDYYREE